ncbi:ATP-binding protein [Pseudonocardia sp. MH-G8]|uniref:ATP-binding protein n=1 Tax=Pseudonocardia sp. MH-G8 TaxID=1854588 RepID=UPI000B9FA9A8|nr:ATP-binding protein [Pseudonocardia sp. MH-G8]OZM79322.1 hypothetical protein CFP66_26610 [Pseudonocardia sp. MH-G8]
MTTAAGRIGAVVPAGMPAALAYAVCLLVSAVLSLAALVLGVVGWILSADPSGVAAAAAAGDPWAHGVLAAAQTGGPAVQRALDLGLSVLSLVVAGALFAGKDGTWSTRLLALAMVGSAGAFDLQAHAAAMGVETALGLQIGLLHQLVFQGVPGVAYILALLLFPPEREPRPARSARVLLVLACAGTLLLVGLTSPLPHAVSGVLLLGFLGPVVGVLVLPRQIREAPTATARTQARLLFSVVAVASAIAIVLAVITLLMWSTGWGGLLLLEHPTIGAHGEPTALLYWFSRVASIAIAAAAFVATRRAGLWNAERLFSRGLAAGLTAALVGGGYVLVRSAAGLLVGDGALVATVLAALALRPAYVRAERWTDQLLFGSRPTPYSVLAGVTALSRVTATSDAPDLARVAEAVGRGLGAATCRLTVTRPGLRDRSYTWTDGAQPGPDELVEVVVRHGTEAIGTLAVDYAAVAGLEWQRRHLLEDVAESLGAVLQASRYGIELERQLRAALAHASEIAASRRAVVAEMDRERRRIERDLHDGAQHHLVSLRLSLGLVEHQVSTARFDEARERLEQVAGQIDVAESVLAETATGVSSPLLAQVGLVGALEKELAGGQPPVAVDASAIDHDGRFPQDVESAVYFCCLEAVNNARKHAPGAPIRVRLHTEPGRLCFSVQDDGPGWDAGRAVASPGRGLRNVTTRVSAVGGRIEVRSAPGRGTAVAGSVPVADAGALRPRAAPDAAGEATAGLVDQVREAVREARERYGGTEHLGAVRALAERLDAPLRVGVYGDGSAALVPVLAAPDEDGQPGAAVLVDAAASPPGDAFVVVLPRRDGEVEPPDRSGVPARHRPAHAIGALVVDDPVDEPGQRAAVASAARREVRRLCHVVVPVAPEFAKAGARLSDEQYRILQSLAGADGLDPQDVPAGALAVAVVAGDGARPVMPAASATPTGVPSRPVPFGQAVVRFAVAEIRSGRAPSREALAAALVEAGGVPRLRELLAQRLACRAEGLKARAVLMALEDLVRRVPPPAGGEGLRYRLDRTRARAHELAELDVVDALRAGELDVPDAERDTVERLLGAAGTDPRTRLGLVAGATQREVAQAAGEELARWRRLAEHPLPGVDVRRTADVVVRACERVLVANC